MLEQVLHQIPILADLSPEQLDLLKPIFSLEICPQKRVIFEQGAPANYLYIVIKGEVLIQFKPHDGEIITVARIKEGGVFGWSAALGNETYTSGAICIAQTKLLKVLGEDLKNLRQNHPETGILILERLAEVVLERVKRTGAQSQVVALLEHALKNGVKPIGG